MARTTAGGRDSGNSRFASIPSVQNPRSTFNRSYGHKTTFDSGYLIPILIEEILPGDTMALSGQLFARMATPLTPVMDNMHLDVFFFSVPLRLLWDNFQKFMGEQANPADSTDFITPKCTAPASTGYAVGSLQDYMGIPPLVPDLEHIAFPMRAMNLIWNEWFRDENLQDSVVVDLDDGPDDPADYTLLKRGKRHDYFTSCLPFPQKGPSVLLPIGSSAPVIPDAVGANPTWNNPSDPTNIMAMTTPGAGNAVQVTPNSGAGTSGETFDWVSSGLMADLTNATASTINQIREAFQIQKLYERDARGGTRYTEIVRSHFGVISPDARLQRPEYLGGGSSIIDVHPVATTAPWRSPSLDADVGDLAAFVTVNDGISGFVKSFTEHCIVIGLMMVRADLTYQEGMNRMWSRSTRFDYYWPSFAHLGEQEVLQGEIFSDGTSNDNIVFGYQERYAEYRYAPSRISGKFRSQDPTSLDVWHLAQDFGTAPVLNAAFIEENPPIDRVISVPSEPEFLFDSWFNIKHVRAMPAYSVPGLVDHF